MNITGSGPTGAPDRMHWVKAMTFDFWGTLVDVDKSGHSAMRRLAASLNLKDADPAALYSTWDDATVRRYRSDVWRPYVEWTAHGLRDTFANYGIELPDEEWRAHADAFVKIMTSEAKPHPEAPKVIRALKSKFPLMPITNMDERYLRLNPFQAAFDSFVTAEEARAFKPSADIFRLAIKKLGFPPDSILHVSLSQFADLEGAMPLGMKVAWINRGREPLGRYTPKPLYEFSDLTGLATLFE
jgi:2-haloalkanoic acid dehalogenase type II